MKCKTKLYTSTKWNTSRLLVLLKWPWIQCCLFSSVHPTQARWCCTGRRARSDKTSGNPSSRQRSSVAEHSKSFFSPVHICEFFIFFWWQLFNYFLMLCLSLSLKNGTRSSWWSQRRRWSMLIRRPCSTWLPLTALVIWLRIAVKDFHNDANVQSFTSVKSPACLNSSYHGILNNTSHSWPLGTFSVGRFSTATCLIYTK